ncbi:hypothetical protein ACN28S_38635 [Cystobacter fuscus]
MKRTARPSTRPRVGDTRSAAWGLPAAFDSRTSVRMGGPWKCSAVVRPRASGEGVNVARNTSPREWARR